MKYFSFLLKLQFPEIKSDSRLKDINLLDRFLIEGHQLTNNFEND